MSLFLHSALPTLLVLGLSVPAVAPVSPVRQSTHDATALAMFKALISSDIETSGLAAKKAENSDVREVVSSFEQGHRGLLKNTQNLAKKKNMAPAQLKQAPLG